MIKCVHLTFIAKQVALDISSRILKIVDSVGLYVLVSADKAKKTLLLFDGCTILTL